MDTSANDQNGTIHQPVSQPSSFANTPKTYQTGLDRYLYVVQKAVKRRRNQNSPPQSTTPNINGIELHNNRYDTLAQLEAKNQRTPKQKPIPKPEQASERPPPIYLRTNANTTIINEIKNITTDFFITALKKGSINETKIQLNNVDSYRKLTAHFEKINKPFYSYQLKSDRGKMFIIRGIDSSVPPDDVKNELVNLGWKIKTVFNMVNRDKNPLPLFKIELDPVNSDDNKSLFDLRYLLHRKISVEPPRGRGNTILQCMNCQEFNHSHNYCRLKPVCVVCAGPHATKDCTETALEHFKKKCSNCGGDHTANYRQCPVYKELRAQLIEKRNANFKQTGDAPGFKMNINEFVPLPRSAPNIIPATIQWPQAPNPTNVANDEVLITVSNLSKTMERFTESINKQIQMLLDTMNTLMQLLLKTMK